jgi:hypothetical protein
VLYSLLTLLDKSDKKESDENVFKLNTNLLLAFKEQKRSLSAVAPSFLYSYRSFAKLLYPQINQEHNQSRSGYVRLAELRHSFPFRSQDQEGEEP